MSHSRRLKLPHNKVSVGLGAIQTACRIGNGITIILTNTIRKTTNRRSTTRRLPTRRTAIRWKCEFRSSTINPGKTTIPYRENTISDTISSWMCFENRIGFFPEAENTENSQWVFRVLRLNSFWAKFSLASNVAFSYSSRLVADSVRMGRRFYPFSQTNLGQPHNISNNAQRKARKDTILRSGIPEKTGGGTRKLLANGQFAEYHKPVS